MSEPLPSVPVPQPSKRLWLRVIVTDGPEPVVGRPATLEDIKAVAHAGGLHVVSAEDCPFCKEDRR